MKTFLRAGVLGLSFASAAMSLAMAQTPSSAGENRFRATTLDLAAQGEVKVAPDMATIGLGVTAQASTAARALSDNAERMTRMLAALKAAGIAAKDIQTSGLNLNAQYTYEQGQPPRLTGYQASNQVSVAVRDLARLGAAVDATVGAGADQVSGISFGLTDPAAAENAARLEAVHALQAKAALYARATGYRVARLVSLTEGAASNGPRAPMPMMAMARAQKVETPVASGELDVRIDVAGVYELTR